MIFDEFDVFKNAERAADRAAVSVRQLPRALYPYERRQREFQRVWKKNKEANRRRNRAARASRRRNRS